MRVWQIQGAFGLENLVELERPEPRVGHGQLRLRMRMVSLNFRDLLMVRGLYNPRQPLPLVPCSDGVGEVVEVGPGVEGFAVGERVMPIFAQGWLSGEPTRAKLSTTLGGPLDGTLAEQMVVDAAGVVRVPAYLSDAGASTLACAGVTAWHALMEAGRVGPGDTVLVLGTGGVSMFALQIARMAGARVVVTSSSDAKIARAVALGATAGVNYRTHAQWGREVRRLVGGDGVDHVVEVGGAGTLEQSLVAVRAGGTVSVIGVLGGAVEPVNVLPVLMRNLRLQGVMVGHREMFERLVRAMALHAMAPVVDRVFGWGEAREALEYLGSGAHFGKVCVSVGS